MEKTNLEQEREIRDIIRRAKGFPDKTSPVRRETLKRLIDLIHAPHPTLKILAAQNIRFFFNDFPELEEVAINAVYDLCEDQSSKVRIEGYTAITQVSKIENKWVKRNADVLLQLLQSDEPDEVIVVKKALMEHLDMDPKVTLGVLCDQIVPLEEPLDEEEQLIRDRLRSLVLSFLTREAKRAVVERHAIPGSAAEDTLINCLLETIPKLGLSDIEIIVKDLLLSLTVYRPQSSRGYILLQVLLDKTVSFLRTGLRSGSTSLFKNVRICLDLVAVLVIEKRAASAIHLLRFYCSNLSGRMTLQKFSADDQTSIICNISETFVAANEDTQSQDEGQPLEALGKQIVDACPFLLECLLKHGLNQKRSIDACTILLRACIRRKEESHWIPPPHLVTVLRDFQMYKNEQDIQILIRSLISTPNDLSQGQASNTTQTPKTLHPRSSTFHEHNEPPSLPEKPLHARRMVVQTRNRPPDQLTEPRPSASTSRFTPPKHSLSQPESSRSPKRRREDGEEDVGPSLLSRLGSSFSASSTRSVSLAEPTPNSNNLPNPPEFGYSIKGAAKIAAREHPHIRTSTETMSLPLLARLKDTSSTGPDPRNSGGWKKKRGRTY